jgi:hypothetical protein
MSSQALAKSSGDSFLSILSSASAGQNPGAIGPDEDPHADGDARGAETDSKEQNEPSLMASALDGGIRSNGSGQHIVQKNDSVVESASTEGQNTATSNGPRVAVPGARPTGTSEQTKDASTTHAFVSSAEAPTQASIEAQATVGSLQGAMASSSAAAAFNSPLPADDPGSGGENVRPLSLSVPDSSAENGTGLQSSGSIRTNPSGAEPPAGVLDSSLPPVAVPLGTDSMLNFAKDPSGDANPGQANPLDSALSQQGDGSWSGFGSTVKSADRADGPSAALMQGLGSAQPGLKPLSDFPVPETKATPGKQSTSAANPILSNASSGTAGKSTDPVASVAATEAGIAGIVPLALPALSARAATGSGNQPVVNGPTKASSNPADAKNTTAASATVATSGNAIDNGNGAVEGSSHNTQSNGQPAQDTPAPPALTLGTAANGADSAAARVQTQVPVAQTDATTTAGTHRMPDGSGVPSELAGQQAAGGPVHEEGSEPVGSSSINTARLVQSMSESEMRVGMHSSEFGDISIRTSVSQQQMVAQITLDHGDLSQAIAAHASTLQAKLGEDYGIHASIEVHNLGSGFGNDPGQSSQREQRDFRHSARAEIALPGAEASSSIQFAAVASISSGNRLDIRA